jgi:hypothetical protein
MGVRRWKLRSTAPGLMASGDRRGLETHMGAVLMRTATMECLVRRGDSEHGGVARRQHGLGLRCGK